MQKIIATDVPKEFKRLNLIVGHTLYGAVSKRVKVLGKYIEETEWEPVKKIPREIIELDDHRIRAYLDKEKGIVQAIEILEKAEKKKTAAKKAPAKKKPAKKANPSSSTRRNLHKVPKE
jgi:hypothetical protein